MLGRQPSDVIGAPLSALIGSDYPLQIDIAAQQADPQNAAGLPIVLNGAAFEGFLHRHLGVLVLELELQPSSLEHTLDDGNTRNFGRILQRLHSADSLISLYQISVEEIQAVTGYDRVLIYRFEEEGHGQVLRRLRALRWKCFKDFSSRLRIYQRRRESFTAPIGYGSFRTLTISPSR